MASTSTTTPTPESVDEHLDRIENDQRRADARVLRDLMAEVTGEPARLWGPSIVGFGSAHYRYPTGTEGDTPLASFAARKAQLVIYLVGLFDTEDADDLARLGPHSTGKGCLNVKRLADVDQGALRSLIERSVRFRREMDPTRS